jgi:hypothetical protein
MNPMDMAKQFQTAKQREQEIYAQMPNKGLGGSYLSEGGFNTNDPNMDWEGYLRQLGFSNLENMTNFQSPLYQQYAQYLQKTQGGIGVNSLLAPLMAGGSGYAGGQAIASQKASEMGRERQDKINTGVQGFAMNMQNNVMGQLGQIGGSFNNTLNRNAMDAQTEAANNPLNQLGGVFGSVLGMLNPFGGGAAKSGGGSVGGYNG